jgi:hypothetical protein
VLDQMTVPTPDTSAPVEGYVAVVLSARTGVAGAAKSSVTTINNAEAICQNFLLLIRSSCMLCEALIFRTELIYWCGI